MYFNFVTKSGWHRLAVAHKLAMPAGFEAVFKVIVTPMPGMSFQGIYFLFPVLSGLRMPRTQAAGRAGSLKSGRPARTCLSRSRKTSGETSG